MGFHRELSPEDDRRRNQVWRWWRDDRAMLRALLRTAALVGESILDRSWHCRRSDRAALGRVSGCAAFSTDVRSSARHRKWSGFPGSGSGLCSAGPAGHSDRAASQKSRLPARRRSKSRRRLYRDCGLDHRDTTSIRAAGAGRLHHSACASIARPGLEKSVRAAVYRRRDHRLGRCPGAGATSDSGSGRREPAPGSQGTTPDQGHT